MSGPAPLLSLRGVSKNFGGLAVISDVSFDVPQGSRLALIGPNGAGKTTIFNLISGVYALSAGEITMEGRDISAIASRKRAGLGIARSFQNIRLMPHLSAVENVMLGQQAHAGTLKDMITPLSLFGKSAWRRDAEELLGSMGLGTFPGEVGDFKQHRAPPRPSPDRHRHGRAPDRLRAPAGPPARARSGRRRSCCRN